MPILSFNVPKKLRSTEEHAAEHSSDTNISGTYVPNMSESDQLTWKAKKIGGEDPRIEIRKTVDGKEHRHRRPSYAQVLLIVRPDGSVVMSANGRMVFDTDSYGTNLWNDLHQAVSEARECLGVRNVDAKAAS